MTVARRFIAGVRDYMACVPEGRLSNSVAQMIRRTKAYDAQALK